MRALAVDHGEKRIGIAVSDSTGTLARPLAIIEHVSRIVDAAHVLRLALENQVTLIVIGQSADDDGYANPAGRRAARFAAELRTHTEIPLVLWDESLSTQDARARQRASGVSRKKRAGRVDALAAAMILQSYLDANRSPAGGIVES